jgi:hypothetical protein
MNTSTLNNVQPISIGTIEAKYNPGLGRHWFDKATMRFFRTRLPQYGYQGKGGIYFVSSEQYPKMAGGLSERAYSVRKLVGPGDIETIGGFMTYTKHGAHSTARRLAAGAAFFTTEA